MLQQDSEQMISSKTEIKKIIKIPHFSSFYRDFLKKICFFQFINVISETLNTFISPENITDKLNYFCTYTFYSDDTTYHGKVNSFLVWSKI